MASEKKDTGEVLKDQVMLQSVTGGVLLLIAQFFFFKVIVFHFFIWMHVFFLKVSAFYQQLY